MATARSTFAEYQSQADLPTTEEIVRISIYSLFRAKFEEIGQTRLRQMERRDRVVLLLLDGRRTLRDVARLIHRGERDVALTLVRLLRRGYIEFLER